MAFAGTAAAARPLPADQHTPAVTADLPTMRVAIGSRDTRGYTVSAELTVMGATSKTDRIRFDWKARGKVIGSGACESSYRPNTKVLLGSCEMETPVKAIGPVEVDVIYTDDQEDKDYLVTTLKLVVKHWKGIGKTEYWGYTPDDLLAVGVVFHDNDHHTQFEFWATSWGGEPNQTFRCTVDGKKLPDFDAHIDRARNGTTQIESEYMNDKKQQKFMYTHYAVRPSFSWGVKADFDQGTTNFEKLKLLSDHPGAWACVLRVGGKPTREFMFTVNEKGWIGQSEMQSGKHPVPLLPGTSLIDMKISKGSPMDNRIRPDALKKSIGFGLPWPDSPKAKELQASFPPAVGAD